MKKYRIILISVIVIIIFSFWFLKDGIKEKFYLDNKESKINEELSEVNIITKNEKLNNDIEITQKEKLEIEQAFRLYTTNYDEWLFNFYRDSELVVIVNQVDGLDIKGHVNIKDSENHSSLYFLATKKDNIWKILATGQDYPLCDWIEPYNFSKIIAPICFISATEIKNR